jgi:hypothetical protein
MPEAFQGNTQDLFAFYFLFLTEFGKAHRRAETVDSHLPAPAIEV